MSLRLKKNRRAPLYCSFCGKRDDEVIYLIAGPTVFICNECVEMAREIGAKLSCMCADRAYALPDPAPLPRIPSVEEAALDVCHAWRDNAVSSDGKLVKALIDPIAELGRALAQQNK